MFQFSLLRELDLDSGTTDDEGESSQDEEMTTPPPPSQRGSKRLRLQIPSYLKRMKSGATTTSSSRSVGSRYSATACGQNNNRVLAILSVMSALSLMIAWATNMSLLHFSPFSVLDRSSKLDEDYHESQPLTIPPDRTATSPLATEQPLSQAVSSITAQPRVSIEDGRPKQLDFFIIGFPKTGTTSLLYSFKKNNETAIPPKEYCDLSKAKDSDEESISKLATVLESTAPKSDPLSNVKLGIKCPMAVRNLLGIERLGMRHVVGDHNNFVRSDTRLIVGVRHPVLFFQSFYNYRVTEMHNRDTVVNVPPPESLVGNQSWKGVSTDLAQFEFYLMQLGKISLHNQELTQLASKGLSVSRLTNRNPVFVYCVEQLDERDAQRATEFRTDLQHFLGLEQPILPFSRENSNHATHYPEHMDICDARFDTLRGLLLAQAKGTQRWLRERFVVESDEIVAGGRKHFLELLAQWTNDPCASAH